jgi:hypothetical protein
MSDPTEYCQLLKKEKAHPRSIVGVEFFYDPQTSDISLGTFAHDSLKIWNVIPSDDSFDISLRDTISAWNCGMQSYDADKTGKCMAVVGSESTLHYIVRNADGQATITNISRGFLDIWFVRISPLPDTFLSVSFAGSLQLINAAGEVTLSSAFDKVKQISAIQYSHTGKVIAVANSQGWITIVNPEKLNASYALEGHAMKVRCLAFTVDDKQLLSGADDKTIKITNLEETRGVFFRNLCGHRGAILSIRIDLASEGERCASSATDRRIILWDLLNYTQLHVLETGLVDIINSVAFSHDGRFLAAVSDDSTVFVYKVPQPKNYVPPAREEREAVLFEENGLPGEISTDDDDEEKAVETNVKSEEISMEYNNEDEGIASPEHTTTPPYENVEEGTTVEEYDENIEEPHDEHVHQSPND